MEPGDMVKITSVDPASKGILIEKWGVNAPDWWVVLDSRGEIITWPQSQLQLDETFIQEENNG